MFKNQLNSMIKIKDISYLDNDKIALISNNGVVIIDLKYLEIIQIYNEKIDLEFLINNKDIQNYCCAKNGFFYKLDKKGIEIEIKKLNVVKGVFELINKVDIKEKYDIKVRSCRSIYLEFDNNYFIYKEKDY